MDELNRKILELLPDLKELTEGCEVEIDTPKRYEEVSYGDRTKGIILQYTPSHPNYDDWTDDYLILWLPEWNETHDISNANFEDPEDAEYVKVIGKEPTLSDVLRAIEMVGSKYPVIQNYPDRQESVEGGNWKYFRNKLLDMWNLSLGLNDQPEFTKQFILSILNK